MRFSGFLSSSFALTVLFWGMAYLFSVYTRKPPFIIFLSNGVALTTAFEILLVMFAYALMFWGARFPLADAYFGAADQLLGMDWRAFQKWMNQHPLLAQIMEVAYYSYILQSFAIVVILSILARHRRLQIFLLAAQMTGLATCVIAAFMPAVGTYEFFQITPGADHLATSLPTATAHVADVLRLRGAAPLLPFERVHGVVTFPSYHAVLGVLFAWAWWPVRGFRWIGLVLNVTMIAATPLSGAHYFVDVLAGIAVAWVGLSLANTIANRIEKKYCSAICATTR